MPHRHGLPKLLGSHVLVGLFVVWFVCAIGERGGEVDGFSAQARAKRRVPNESPDSACFLPCGGEGVEG